MPLQRALSQPIDRLPSLSDSSLVGAWLNKAVRSSGDDYSPNGNDGTVTGATWLDVGARHDGTDDKIDFGDIGNIQTILFWVYPHSTTEEMILVDAGNDIMVSGGTITYTGLTAAATYVNGSAGTTLAANEWSRVMCVFTQIDANNFETANDGSNYGQVDIQDLRAYDAAKTAGFAAFDFHESCPEG